MTIAYVDAQARWDEWSGIDLPTLAVFARDGMFNAAARSESIARGRQVKRVDLVAGGHDAHLDAFALWIEAVSTFIDEES